MSRFISRYMCVCYSRVAYPIVYYYSIEVLVRTTYVQPRCACVCLCADFGLWAFVCGSNILLHGCACYKRLRERGLSSGEQFAPASRPFPRLAMAAWGLITPDMVAASVSDLGLKRQSTLELRHAPSKVKLRPCDGVTSVWMDEFMDVLSEQGCSHVLSEAAPPSLEALLLQSPHTLGWVMGAVCRPTPDLVIGQDQLRWQPRL